MIESYLQGKFQFKVIKSQFTNINNKNCLQACLKDNEEALKGNEEAVKGNEEAFRDKHGALKSDKMH